MSEKHSMELSTLDSRFSGCPDSGVKINTISKSNGKTVAEALVTRNEANVVLEVHSNGQIAGYTVAEFKGEEEIIVDAVGDTAILRPLGCNQWESRRSY